MFIQELMRLVESKDSAGKEIKAGVTLMWTDANGDHVGKVTADPKYNGGLKIGGRSVKNIIDDSDKVMVIKEGAEMTIDLDIADWDDKGQEEKIARKLAKNAQVTYKLKTLIGPGGGNPLYSFTGSEAALRSLYKEYLGGDSEADSEFDEFFMKNGAVKEQYEDSSDFDADMGKIQEHLKAALAIIDSHNWADHIDQTEANFDMPNLRGQHDELYGSIQNAIDSAEEFYNMMADAS